MAREARATLDRLAKRASTTLGRTRQASNDIASDPTVKGGEREPFIALFINFSSVPPLTHQKPSLEINNRRSGFSLTNRRELKPHFPEYKNRRGKSHEVGQVPLGFAEG